MTIPNHNNQTIFDLLLEHSKSLGFIWTDQHMDAILEDKPMLELAQVNVLSIADRVSTRRAHNTTNTSFTKKVMEKNNYSSQIRL